MKKVLIVLAVGLIGLTFAGCGNGQATSEKAVAELADPWETVESLSAAEEAAGFTMEMPSLVDMDIDSVVRYCAALKEIEIQTSDPAGYFRKAKDNGDISGDYNKYDEVVQLDVDGNKVTLKGDAEDLYNLAVWTAGEYSYAIGLDEPLFEAEMKELVAGLK